MVGDHSVSEDELDELADGRRAVSDQPRGRGVAVDRHDRTMLREIGEPFAVAARLDGHRPVLDRDGLQIGGLVVEHRESLVATLESQDVGVVVSRFGESRDVLRTPPVMGPVPIRIGDDVAVQLGDGRVLVDRRVVEHRLGAVEQPAGSGVDDAVAAAGEDHQFVLHPNGGDRVVDGDERDRGDRRADPRVTQRAVVDHRDHRRHDERFAVRNRVDQSGIDRRRRGQLVGDDFGPGELEPVVCHVARHPDGVDAQEAGDSRDRLRFDRVALNAVVEGEQQVHRRRASQWEQVAGHERPLGEGGQRLIDRVPPLERAELGAGDLEDPVAGGTGIERCRCVEPRCRRVLITFQCRIHEAAGS